MALHIAQQSSATRGRSLATVSAVLLLTVLLLSFGSIEVALDTESASAHLGVHLKRRPSSLLVPTLARAEASLATKSAILYGDSLAWEARAPFVASFASVGVNRVLTRTFGGTAICDWLPQMRLDAAQLHPDAVVLEFSGNDLTPCMRNVAGPLTGAAYFTEYARDARMAVGTFVPHRTRVFLAGSPITREAEQAHDSTTERLNRMYQSIARHMRNTQYVDAGTAVLLHGRWTATLPCLPTEPCTGGIDSSGRHVDVVRAPDGRHFCPQSPPAIDGVTDSCPLWSSGAYRYGTALAVPVIAELLNSSSGSTVRTISVNRKRTEWRTEGRPTSEEGLADFIRRKVATLLTIGHS